MFALYFFCACFCAVSLVVYHQRVLSLLFVKCRVEAMFEGVLAKPETNKWTFVCGTLYAGA